MKRNKIDTQFISAVRHFVLNNQFALEEAADELIRDSEFKQIMIKSGEIASMEESDGLIHKTKMIIEINCTRTNSLEKIMHKQLY